MPSIDFLQAVQPAQISKPQAAAPTKGDTPKFSETLNQLVSQVDELHKEAGSSVESFIAGENGNLHEVMASVEEAQLSFQLMMEIRNKLLESYQELMRMQV